MSGPAWDERLYGNSLEWDERKVSELRSLADRVEDDLREVYVFPDYERGSRQVRAHYRVARRRRQRTGILILSGWILACLLVLAAGLVLLSLDVLALSVVGLLVGTPLIATVLGHYEVFGGNAV